MPAVAKRLCEYGAGTIAAPAPAAAGMVGARARWRSGTGHTAERARTASDESVRVVTIALLSLVCHPLEFLQFRVRDLPYRVNHIMTRRGKSNYLFRRDTRPVTTSASSSGVAAATIVRRLPASRTTKSRPKASATWAPASVQTRTPPR
jgi:hypothetical protein